MALHFVTSAQTDPHIKSSDDARAYSGLFGNGAYVFKTGNKLSASMVDSNTLRIMDGDSIFCGRKWNIRNFEDVTIENGTPGFKRVDLIAVHFETSPSEEISLVVYKGTEVDTGDPVVPTYIEGDLNAGDTVAEMPLYTVSLNGLTVGSPSQMFVVVDDLYGDWLLNATKALFGVTDDKKIPGTSLVPHSIGKDQLETSVWDSISHNPFLSQRVYPTTYRDFNKLPIGLWFIDTDMANSPATYKWCDCLVVGTESSVRDIIVFTSNGIYTRRRSSSTDDSWSQWILS